MVDQKCSSEGSDTDGANANSVGAPLVSWALTWAAIGSASWRATATLRRTGLPPSR